MSKHTPGPWRVTLGYQVPPGFLNFRVEEHTHTEVVTLDENGDEVDPNDKNFTYKLANARLIAAAPELLAACKNALSGMEAIVGFFTNIRDYEGDDAGMILIRVLARGTHLPDLRAAIAKAEGKDNE